MLERQVLILSSNLDELSLLTESLSYLLFPFTLPTTYIPLLPTCKDAESFLEAPVPYLMGVFAPSLNQGKLIKKITKSFSSHIFLNIDFKDIIILISDLTQRLRNMFYQIRFS